MLIFNDTFWPSVSVASVTVCRLGRKTRFLLLFAWLTKWPLWTPLPVNSQRRAMGAVLHILAGQRGGLLRKAILSVKEQWVTALKIVTNRVLTYRWRSR